MDFTRTHFELFGLPTTYALDRDRLDAAYRELQNAVQFGLVKCDNKTITPADLPLELRPSRNLPPRPERGRKLNVQAVQEALAKTAGNKARAARTLGVGRATLYRFLEENPEADMNA